MRKVARIRLRRAEGPSDLCTDWQDYSGFPAANDQLKTWAETAPIGGGYDKCDFEVIYKEPFTRDEEDPDIYEGRFDLQRQHAQGANLLQEQMREVVLSYWDLRDGLLILG